MKMKLKRGDRVRVIAGKDAGSEGKVLSVDREKNRVIVEHVNMVTKHQKPGRTNQTGGIVKIEAPIHASNLMYLHKGKPTRIGYEVEIIDRDGVKEKVKHRIAKSTGEMID